VLIALLLFTTILSTPAFSQESDQTLSPYFQVNAASEGEDLLPLLSTETNVNIAGVIADVKVTQIYKNDGSSPLEAKYIFPGSTRAAVYGMTMTIGERVRVAKIKEKAQAKKIYTEAKKQGKSASLLEQKRPNVFQMSVANILPGDRIKVELSYTEYISPTKGVYEFVYPGVVGPRYSNTPAVNAPVSEKWVANPYLTSGKAAPYDFNITATINGSIPLQEVASTTHKVDVSFLNASQAEVQLSNEEHNASNRDYILRYRLQGEQVDSGLLLYEGDEENFFLLTVQPPKRVVPEQIPPREYIFIVDVSGSMYGFPLNISKQLMKDLLGGLRPTDTFNILLFAGDSRFFSKQSLPATSQNITSAISMMENQRGGGGTELLPALQRALNFPHEENSSRSFIVMTDGYIAADREAIDLIRGNLNNANVYSFGIGSSVNRFLIEGLARAGAGEPFILTDAVQAESQAATFREYIASPVLTNITVDYGDFEVYDIEPPSIPDVLAERPVVVFGKWRGKPTGTIDLSGISGDTTYSQTLDVSETTPMSSNSALRYLWARNRIQTLSDYNAFQGTSDTRGMITKLGLQYNLLTKYTSFVAVDDVVRNPGGEQKSVKQPLPLPKGVSNLAVGGMIPTTPEPETYLLMGMIGLLLLWTAVRHREQLLLNRR
jgi:Ca-activated chloride channel family protein